jgi:hypothetical protein
VNTDKTSSGDFDCGEGPRSPEEKGLSRRRSWFFRLTVPTAWLSAATVSWAHPGDEYCLFLVSAIPAFWVTPFVPSTRLPQALPVLFAAGFVAMGLAGWLMDALRVRLVPWLVAVACGVAFLLWLALSAYPDLDQAIARNGSLTAYASAATNMSLYLSSFLAVGLASLYRAASAVVGRLATSQREGETP